MIGPLGRQGMDATLGQLCPEMFQIPSTHNWPQAFGFFFTKFTPESPCSPGWSPDVCRRYELLRLRLWSVPRRCGDGRGRRLARLKSRHS